MPSKVPLAQLSFLLLKITMTTYNDSVGVGEVINE